MTRHDLQLRSSAALAVLALGGCGLALAGQPLPENRCGSDAECGPDRCDTARHLCVGELESPLRIGFTVLPAEDPFGGAPIQSVFAPSEVTQATARDLELSPRMTVVGMVRFMGQPVAADVRFRRASPIPGSGTVEVSALTLAEPATAADGHEADYSLRVAGGERYDVFVSPTGEASHYLPPMHVAVETPTADLGRADLIYPDALAGPCAEARFAGCSFTGEVYGINRSGETVPEDGLLVRAVDAETGELVSSVARSGASTDPDGVGEPGVFTLRIAPGAGPWLLKITGGEERTLFPAVIADPALFFPGSARPRVLVPRLPSVRYVGFVESAAGERLGNASVSFHASQVFDSTTQLSGSFDSVVTSELDASDPARAGRFEVALLPGEYEVTITPQGGSGLGVSQTTLTVTPRPDGAAIMGRVFTAPSQARLGGLLTTASGDVLPGVSFSAVARSRADVRVSTHNRTVDTLTDGLGQFALGLDVGVYDLVAKPPAETGYPWALRRSLEIGVDDRVRTENVVVSSPLPVEGAVRSPDGAAMVGARVTAIAVLPDARGGERAVAVGEAVTDADGRYELLLPSSLP